MDTFITVLKIVNSWVIYPMVIFFALSYAKQSATQELNKAEKFTYWACIIALLLGGVN